MFSLQNAFIACHDCEFISNNQMPEDYISLSIHSSESIILSVNDTNFYDKLNILTNSYKCAIDYLSDENDFFKPEVIIRPNINEIMVRFGIKKKNIIAAKPQ